MYGCDSGSIVCDEGQLLSALDQLMLLALQEGAIQHGRFTELGMARLKRMLGVTVWPLHSRSVTAEGATDLPLTRLVHLALVMLQDSEALAYKALVHQHSYLKRLKRLRGTGKGLIRSRVRGQVAKVNTLNWRELIQSPLLGRNKEERLGTLYYLTHPWMIPDTELVLLHVSRSTLLAYYSNNGLSKPKKPLKPVKQWLQQQGMETMNETSFKNGINRSSLNPTCAFNQLSPLMRQYILEAVACICPCCINQCEPELALCSE